MKAGMGAALLILLATFFWALDGLVRYPLLGQLSAYTIVTVEHAFLLLIYLPIFFRKKDSFFKVLLESPVKKALALFAIGILGSAYATLAFTASFYRLGPTIPILLQKLQPLVVISVGKIFTGEKVRRPYFFWAALALVGATLLSLPGLFTDSWSASTLAQQHPRQVILALSAVLGWGLSTAIGKWLTNQGVGHAEILTGRFFSAFCFLALLPLLFSATWQEQWGLSFSTQAFSFSVLSFSTLAKIFFLALISGVLGLTAYYQGLKKIPAHVATLLELGFPLFAVILNWLILGISLSGLQIFGSILILLGPTVIQLKKY